MSRIKISKLILGLIALIICGVFIAGNIVLAANAPTIHRFFAASMGDGQTEQGENTEGALLLGDELVRKIGDESMVLLKNNGLLPMEKPDCVNLFGWNSTDNGWLLTGGGAGGTNVNESKKLTLTGAFAEADIDVNEDLIKMYEDYSDYDADAITAASSVLINPPARYYTDDLMKGAVGFSDVAIVTIGRWGRENGGEIPFTQSKLGGGLSSSTDYTRTYLQISAEEQAMLDLVCEKFDKVIVLINSGFTMDLGFLENDKIDAAILTGFTGQSASAAIPRIITGEVNPSGRLADTWTYNSTAYSATYPNATGHLTKNIAYAESIYVGYRWYETADAEGYFDRVNNDYGKGYEGVVQYPFGYGLSYTSFDYSVTWPDMDGIQGNEEFEIPVTVTNTGDKAGREVVQLYYTPPYYIGGVEKSEVNLLAFAKTKLLAPDESCTVTLKFSAYDMAAYDCYGLALDPILDGGYVLEKGDYKLSVRSDAHNVLPSSVCVNAEHDFSVYDSVAFKRDPVTGSKVSNRFTYETAYAGVPIDGTSVYDGINYLSRADFKSTFPRAIGLPDDTAAVEAAKVYRYGGYDNNESIAEEVKSYRYGTDSDMRLVRLENGTAATYSDLAGNTDASFVYDAELMRELSDYENDETWNKFLDQLSRDDIKKLIGAGGYGSWAVESIGLVRTKACDGSSGFSQGIFQGLGAKDSATSYPCAALVGCSWDSDLAYDIGRIQGYEASGTSLRGWYAPGVNLHRTPYNSRNFEYYSEDPVLTAHLGSETVRGAKNYNIYCYVKHFAASEAGNNPSNWSTWLTEQSLRELYLKPFEVCVKQGGANAVMTAFSDIGAVYCGTNYALCTRILRDEWGFRGSLVTDYYTKSYMDYTRCVIAGNDLFLDPNNNEANINLDDPAVAYAARRSVKNIVYTYVDTYVTASDYQKALSDDELKIDTDKIAVEALPFSGLFVFLWVLIDTVLVAGFVVCITFILKRKRRKSTNS